MVAVFKNIIRTYILPKINKWEAIEYFDEKWQARIKTMAQYIKKDESIIDMGCGMGWLKNYLSEQQNYTGQLQ